ncbi:MAG: VOC family protein [Actinobacteria bacterium]|nr:VOC family protein [Actinomycetota bacterium]MBO0786792.1 VOC family protein [Actinomycetota bacterium]
MTDPFSVLSTPVTPADPDPDFAARLRARLARAFDLPEGVEMSGTATIISGAGGEQAAPELGAAIPYLAVRDARQAIGWYTRVLGGRLRGDPITMPDGRIGHAEIELGPGVLYLADAHPEIGARAPEPGGSPVSLVLTVTGLDAVVAAATREGASLDRGPYEGYGHRNATVTDPFGHRWMLQEPLPAAVAAGEEAAAGGPGPQQAGGEGPEEAGAPRSGAPRSGAPQAGALQAGVPLAGDAGYASLWVPDAGRAAEFYAAVLGWEYAPVHDPRSRHVPGTIPPQGLWSGGQPRNTLFCSYVVNDMAAAVARVRAAGGQAGEPAPRPYGLSAECTDNQGIGFALHQPPGAGTGPGAAGRPAARRDGDLVYITMEVPDSALAREFYGSVLGWRAEPGRVADGWQVADVLPMTGISGGHQRPVLVPVWQVSDVAAAVGRVRAAGGTASEPHAEPYGRMAECTDDQGTRFSLIEYPAQPGA